MAIPGGIGALFGNSFPGAGAAGPMGSFNGNAMGLGGGLPFGGTTVASNPGIRANPEDDEMRKKLLAMIMMNQMSGFGQQQQGGPQFAGGGQMAAPAFSNPNTALSMGTGAPPMDPLMQMILRSRKG